MAYSLGDPFRPLRLVMRVNGSTLGLFSGLGLLLPRQAAFVQAGILEGEVGWPLRLAGAALIALGVFYLLAANESMIELPILVTMVVAHSLFAFVLLIAYLRNEFAGLNPLGQILLVIVFILCLLGALAPLRYFQAEYRGY